MKKVPLVVFFIIFCSLILALTLHGLPGNPTSRDLNSTQWKDHGPMELSPERGRFALIYSVIEDHSFKFTKEIGFFAQPDVAISNGRYVSLFAPGLSFITMPGYLLGRMVNLSQVGAFAVVAIFAILNVYLIRSIVLKLQGNSTAANLASLVFLFATPAFTYGVSLYQHHLSTFLILLCLYSLLRWKNFWGTSLIWFICGLSLVIDYPNLFLLSPIAIYALGRFIDFKKVRNKIILNIKMAEILSFITLAIPLTFFLWFNQASYNNPFQLSGTLKTARNVPNPYTTPVSASDFSTPQPSPTSNKKEAVKFFRTREMFNGLYILLVSPERGILVFTPIMIVGLIGAVLAYQKKVKLTTLLISILFINLLLYSMWDDPWGGWAFGARYLIPSYALLAIFIGLSLSYFNKKVAFLIVFFILFCYSTSVNVLGALTSKSIPPKGEAKALENITKHEEKYSYNRDIDRLVDDESNSFIFQVFVKNFLTAWEYYHLINLSIIIFGAGLTGYLFFEKQKLAGERKEV